MGMDKFIAKKSIPQRMDLPALSPKLGCYNLSYKPTNHPGGNEYVVAEF